MYLIYITFPNLREAKRISRLLLQTKLVGCVNIFPIESMYWWRLSWDKNRETMEQAKEVVVIAKTLKRNYRKVETLVKKLHSYEIPCIYALEVKEVEKKYLKWVRANIK